MISKLPADAIDESSAGGQPDFGPDRRLSLAETGDLPIAMAPGSLPEYALSSDGSVPTWAEASERTVARIGSDSPHAPRFGAKWAEQTRARLLRADEVARDWCQTTVLLTFTGTPYLTDDVDRPMPPCSFVEALTESRSARRDALSDVLDDAGRWITIRVVGAHKSGYPHEHVLISTEAQLSSSDFEPVVGAHRDASPVAGDGGHGIGAIRVESDPNRDEMTGGVAYIAPDTLGVRDILEAEQSGCTPQGVVGEQKHRQRAASVLEATGTQAVRIDSSAGVSLGWD